MKHNAGHTLIEMEIALALLAIIAAMALPRGWALIEDYRLRGACFYLEGLIRQVRALAASNNRYMALVFGETEGEPELAVHLDGNGNGIRRSDIRAGIDPQVRGPWRLGDLFPGVRYGSLPGGATPPFPGLQVGPSRLLSFSPIGSSSSGTVFLSNRHGRLHAVVVLGATGRVRIARWRDGRWESLQ